MHAGSKKGTGTRSGEEKHSHRGKSTESHVDKESILEALNLRPGQTVLDAGCGSGYMSRAFSERVTPAGKVFALDPDPESIEALRKETRGSNIDAMVGDITKPTPLEASSVDLVYISTVLHGFSREQMQGFLKEARRLLKPDAVLAVVEFDKKETPFGPPVSIRLSPEDLKQIVPLAPGNTIRAGEHFYLQRFRNPQTM
jgi:ubiquinone/menaquinone biosynthesis C-methylase UbiE